MTFKEIKTGYPTYHLNRSTVQVSQGKVKDASPAHVQQSNPMQPSMFSPTQPMVVDITIEEGGTTKTYTIPENLDTTYAGDMVISTSRENIIREVEAMKARSEEAIAQQSHHKEVIGKCDTILTEWNPAFKEKKQTEERFGKIEDQIADIGKMVKTLIDKLN